MRKHFAVLPLLCVLTACLSPSGPSKPRVGPYPNELPKHFLAVWITDAGGQPVKDQAVLVEPIALGGAVAFAATNQDGWSGQLVLQGEYRVTAGEQSTTVLVKGHTDVRLTFKATVVKRTGAVRLSGRALADDGGEFNAYGASMFWAAWGFTHDRPRLEQNLADAAAAGAHYIRAIADVGPDGWSDREIDPAWAEYEGLTDLAYDTYGLRLQWTIFGGSRHDDSRDARRALVDRFIALANSRPEKVALVELTNEGWQNFPGDVAEMRELARRLDGATSALVAISAADDANLGATCRLYAGAGVDVATMHYDRDAKDHGFRPSRQPWGYPGEYIDQAHLVGEECDGLPRAAANNEPRGLRSSVAMIDDPFLFAVDYATNFIAGNAAYVLHTGAGIRGGGAEDRGSGKFYLPRQANLRDQPEFAEVVKAIAAARSYLPEGLANWTRANAQWPQFPFSGMKEAVEDGSIVRSFVTEKDGQFIGVVLGITRPIRVTARRGMAFEVLHPATGEVLQRVELGAGGVLELSEWPRTRAGDAGAVVLKGRYQ